MGDFKVFPYSFPQSRLIRFKWRRGRGMEIVCEIAVSFSTIAYYFDGRSTFARKSRNFLSAALVLSPS